jgi:hypothetical protein
MSEQKTVKVRIVVAVSKSGSWNAVGYSVFGGYDTENFIGDAIDGLDDDDYNTFWLTAELSIPSAPEIPAFVEKVETK